MKKRRDIHCFAMDLDHTTLYDSNTLSVMNLEALEDAAAFGIEPVIASGRPFSSLPDCILEVRGIRYAITSNGAAVYELPVETDGDAFRLTVEEKREKAVCIRRRGLSEKQVLQILEVAAHEGADPGFEFFINGRAYACQAYYQDPMRFGAAESYLNYVRSTRTPVADADTFIREHAGELDGLDLIMADPEQRIHLRERLKAAVEGVYITASVENRIEIASQEAGKAAGLAFIRERLGLSREQTAAFGDAENDLDMLAEAGVSIAVANAETKVKEAADYVTAPCRKDGVGRAIYGIFGVARGSRLEASTGIPAEEATIPRIETAEDRIRRKNDEKFMHAALREAAKAEKLQEVPIGCVIVYEGKIIARGYNRRNTDHNTTSHAEINAIRKASRKLGDWRLEGCTMYVTLEPCQMCAGALVQSRLTEVVIGCMNPKAGCAGSVMNLLQVPAFNHQVKIRRGVLEEACSQLLSDFFRKLRILKKDNEKNNEV